MRDNQNEKRKALKVVVCLSVCAHCSASSTSFAAHITSSSSCRTYYFCFVIFSVDLCSVVSCVSFFVHTTFIFNIILFLYLLPSVYRRRRRRSLLFSFAALAKHFDGDYYAVCKVYAKRCYLATRSTILPRESRQSTRVGRAFKWKKITLQIKRVKKRSNETKTPYNIQPICQRAQGERAQFFLAAKN